MRCMDLSTLGPIQGRPGVDTSWPRHEVVIKRRQWPRSVPRATAGWTLVALLAATLAGCADAPEGPGSDPDPQTPAVAGVTVSGRVLDADFQAIPGANVTLFETGDLARTGADGAFRFEDLPEAIYTVTAQATGYLPQTAVARPEGGEAVVDFVLVAAEDDTPFSVTLPVFDGFIECALELLIITPSCDTAVMFVEDSLCDDPINECHELTVFQDDSRFFFNVSDGWRSIVLDVRFDPDEHPGMNGMRVSVYGAAADAEVLDYQRMYQDHAPGPFTTRFDAGVDYGDTIPVPVNGTELRLELYPHSHGYDLSLFLGAGATLQLDFQVVATIFYHAPAPDGFTTGADV